MPVGIGEHLSASQPPLRRASPRSPDDPNWLCDSRHETASSEREKIHQRGRPDEISGLARTFACSFVVQSWHWVHWTTTLETAALDMGRYGIAHADTSADTHYALQAWDCG